MEFSSVRDWIISCFILARAIIIGSETVVVRYIDMRMAVVLHDAVEDAALSMCAIGRQKVYLRLFPVAALNSRPQSRGR